MQDLERVLAGYLENRATSSIAICDTALGRGPIKISIRALNEGHESRIGSMHSVKTSQAGERLRLSREGRPDHEARADHFSHSTFHRSHSSVAPQVDPGLYPGTRFRYMETNGLSSNDWRIRSFTHNQWLSPAGRQRYQTKRPALGQYRPDVSRHATMSRGFRNPAIDFSTARPCDI